MLKKQGKIVLALFVFIFIVAIVFLLIMKSEHQIITQDNEFNTSEIKKITYYNGDYKLTLDKNDEEFFQILSVFEEKSIMNNNAVHMGYKNYKIRLSNMYSSVDISPEFTSTDNSFAQVGKENKITGIYDYIVLNSDDNKVLFDCYKKKTGLEWNLIEDE